MSCGPESQDLPPFFLFGRNPTYGSGKWHVRERTVLGRGEIVRTAAAAGSAQCWEDLAKHLPGHDGCFLIARSEPLLFPKFSPKLLSPSKLPGTWPINPFLPK